MHRTELQISEGQEVEGKDEMNQEHTCIYA